MIMIKRLALAAASVVIMTSSAFAHDYAELEPLAPDLRSFLVTLLEDASASDYLDGDPDMFSAGPAKLSARLGRIIDVANDADMRWLQTADYEELDHPVFGRVPAGVVLQLLSDLVDTVAHAEDHADETPNAALSRDLIRLQALSETQWGQ